MTYQSHIGPDFHAQPAVCQDVGMSQTTGKRSLRAVLQDADAEHFVGREAELATVAELIDAATPSRILFVHGPGGIGKSALLRAAGREAEQAGYAVPAHDARALPADLNALLRRLAPAPNGAPPFLIIDEVDHLGSMLAPLRDALLDRLPAEARVVLAGRGEPDTSWHAEGLPGIVVDLPLGPLADDQSSDYLAQRGVADQELRARIVAWARGYPLALTVAASAPGGQLGSGLETHLEERLTAWLAGRSIMDVDREVLEVAAIARIVDGRLLAAALPGRNTRELLPRLQALPVAQTLGWGSSIHPVLADAIRDRLKATSPSRYRHLVRRIAEHLATRARLGDMDALIELSLLIESPDYRRAIANEPSRHFYADRPHDGEFLSFAREHGFDGAPDWAELNDWRGLGTEYVLRRAEGDMVLWVCAMPVARLLPLGPIAASQLEAARRIGSAPVRSFATVALFAHGTLAEREDVARLASGAFMQHAGVPDLEVIMMTFPEPNRRPGSNAIDSYEIADAGPRGVVISDFRPRGAVGFVEAIVLAEQGFEPREPGNDELLAPTDDPEREERLRVVLDEVFGDSSEERRLREIIEAAHLGPRRSEASLLAQFHVGRTTWYRLLRTARERVLAHH